jgi:16S rRNA (uracil1498-N3)-methyltransferase
MRLHRFFIDSDLSSHKAGSIFIIENHDVNHQLSKVLRAKAGDPIQLFDRTGNQLTGTIQTLNKNSTQVQIDQAEKKSQSEKKTTLYLAMLKRENFELAAQKATELGITAIVPLLTERTVKTGFNQARLEKIVIEAAEQSGRTTVPTISAPMHFTDALRQTHAIKLFLDFNGAPFSSDKKDTDSISSRQVALFVGPEGGWTSAERTAAENAGCITTTIGEHTLRAETAAIVGSFLMTQ